VSTALIIELTIAIALLGRISLQLGRIIPVLGVAAVEPARNGRKLDAVMRRMNIETPRDVVASDR
jgi:hypothetical protein